MQLTWIDRLICFAMMLAGLIILYLTLFSDLAANRLAVVAVMIGGVAASAYLRRVLRRHDAN